MVTFDLCIRRSHAAVVSLFLLLIYQASSLPFLPSILFCRFSICPFFLPFLYPPPFLFFPSLLSFSHILLFLISLPSSFLHSFSHILLFLISLPSSFLHSFSHILLFLSLLSPPSHLPFSLLLSLLLSLFLSYSASPVPSLFLSSSFPFSFPIPVLFFYNSCPFLIFSFSHSHWPNPLT